jgi:hypothetical protein
VAVDSLLCFKLTFHLKRAYMPFKLFIVMKIMVLYCSVTCLFRICFILLIIVCKSHCCVSFVPPPPFFIQLLPICVWQLCIIRPHWATIHSSKNIFHIFVSFIFSHLGKYILLTVMKQVMLKNVFPYFQQRSTLK